MNAQQYNIAVLFARQGACRATVAAVLVLALSGSAAVAQVTTTKAAPEVTIQVREAVPETEIISVPVNQGALVDVSVPVREVRVANPEIAEVTATSPRQILINGKAFGTTQLMLTVEGGVQKNFTVAVDLDLERLHTHIRQIVPRAKVKVSALLDAVVLTGTVPDAESAERIMQIAKVYSTQVINHMRVSGVYQVLLRCTVAEVNRQATRQLGFNGWLAGDNFPNAFGVSQIGGINPVNIGAAGGVNVAGRIPFGTDQQGLNLSPNSTMSFGFPRVQMQIFVQALRENGLLQVLAEPNLVTISGQEANFLAGGEFPIPVATDDKLDVEFREFGVRLKFTPTVVSEDKIRLHIAPEVSEPDYTNAVQVSGFVIPGLTSRRVETVVELGPGETFPIGGLLSEQTRAVSSKVPALGDVPVLGALFSSVDYQQSETELVVLVTPELVRPLGPNQITNVPGMDHIAPNDWELFGLGQIDGEGDPNAAPESSTRGKNNWPARQQEIYGAASVPRLRGPVGPCASEEGM